MSFALASKPAMGLAARPQRSSLKCRAENVPANVAEAREWISAWKSKTGAGSKGSFASFGMPTVQRTGPHWFPGSDTPAHLNGTMPGDFGFDPLYLGNDEFKLKWYQQAELMNGRTAMAAVAGILFPELLSAMGMGGPAAATKWFDHAQFEYYAPISTLTMMGLFLSAWVEIRRYMDIIKPGSVNQDPVFSNNMLSNPSTGYPGFDPMGYSKGAEFETMKVKEIKNGRLAMLAFAGFMAQAYATGTTPLEGLGKHLASPWTTTVWANKEHIANWHLQG